jgi:hypothetical protein
MSRGYAVSGFGPVPLTLTFITFWSRSNQKGAPSETAKPVIDQPMSGYSHSNTLRGVCQLSHPMGIGRDSSWLTICSTDPVAGSVVFAVV